ncbi:MAG TPA: DUF2298 domain-containing protein [Thermomicrobiales bacterium]|nr:DUF2298 domain-containing protein [Thermomicrobiales bacterium]
MSDLLLALRWLVALEVIGWALYPLLYLATPGLRDRGLTLAKPFALLLLVYPVWFLAALRLPVFTAPGLVVAGVLLGALGWLLALRRDRDLLAFLRDGWRYVVLAEVVFIVAFFGYVWLRGFNPEILGTEKPMEIGFLSAATREATAPPTDPWLSGYGINYYYLGYILVAALAKLTAISSSIAFNLGLTTLFASTFTGATGVTANLLASRQPGRAPRVRPLLGGLLGGYLLLLAGNMYAARDILLHGRTALDTWWWGGLGWKSSRVVIDSGFPASIFGANVGPVETINEFPVFSFILGDLHAHVLALPYTILALGLALDALMCSPVAALLAGWRDRRWRGALPGGARLALAALVIGSLYALNSWDLPTYAVIYLAALFLPAIAAARRIAWGEWLAAGAFLAGCVALFAPFYLRFTSLVGGQPFDLPAPWRDIPGIATISKMLGLVIWGKTPAGQFFTVYLLPYTVALLFLTWRWLEGRKGLAQAGLTTPALVVLVLGLVAVVLQMPVFFFAGLLVALAGAVALRRDVAVDADLFAVVLIGAAFALVLLTEVFFIHDIFANRMNTVFKVYYQAWTLLGIAGGYAIARVATAGLPWRAGMWRLPAAGAVALLLLASLAYPIASSRSRTNQFQQWSGLDGLAFVKQANPDEYAGITWVRANVPAGTVVAEAPGCSYGELYGMPHDRVSAFAGVSTPLGWAGHEQQWRGGSPQLLNDLGPRGAAVNRLYSTTDPNEAAAIMRQYDIQYVYVGVFERKGYAAGGIGADCQAGGNYPPAGLAKFDTMLDKVFATPDGAVAVYRQR